MRRRGMTLIEVLVAILVVSLSGLGLLGAYRSVMEMTEVSQQADRAIDDLKDIMERIKTTPFTSLAVVFPSGVADGGGLYAPIVGGYVLSGEQITVAHQPNAAADPRELIVTLRWTNWGRTYQRSLSTMRISESS